MTTKAVVMARGLGTRMRQVDNTAALTADQAAIADCGVKAMIAVADGRPFLDFVLSRLADAGLVDLCLVLGPEHEAMRQRYLECELSRITVQFAVQAEPRGTADAVLAAQAFVGDDSFLVVNADNLYPAEALRALAQAPPPALVGYDRAALVEGSNIEPGRIAQFAALWTDGAGRLTRIVEKPDPATLTQTSLISMNSWHFTSEIFRYCRLVRPSARGELELQEAVTLALADGVAVHVVPWSGGVLDLSNRADIARVTRRLVGASVSL